MPPILPDVSNLIRISKAIAMLDAIICPDWQYRYSSFNSQWFPGEQMASMRNGSGDGYFILFNHHGAILKGYDHESAAAHSCVENGRPLPGMFDGIPLEFAKFLVVPAFSSDETTFCLWRKDGEKAWGCGTQKYPAESDGGALKLLEVLQGDPDFYVRWAADYFEQPVDASAVRRVYRHEPLSEELVRSLNAHISLEQLRDDIEEIAYGT